MGVERHQAEFGTCIVRSHKLTTGSFGFKAFDRRLADSVGLRVLPAEKAQSGQANKVVAPPQRDAELFPKLGGGAMIGSRFADVSADEVLVSAAFE
jgi:hypothetical protein